MKHHSYSVYIAIMGLIITVLIVLGLMGFLSMRSVKADIVSLRQSESNMQNELEQEQTLNASLASIGPSISSVESKIVPPDGEVSFIESIESLSRAQHLNVTVNSVNVSPSGTKGLEYLMIKMTVNGSFASTYRLLSLVESMPYDVQVSGVNIANMTDTANKGPITWEGTFQISALKRVAPSDVSN